MRNLIPSLAVAFTLSASPSFADDPIVWDNGDYFQEGGPIWHFSWSCILENGADVALADDFILEQDSHITGVQWSGLFSEFHLPEAFVIEFYASDPSGTTPTDGEIDPSKTALASYTIQTSDIEFTSDGVWPDPDPDIAADLPTPFEASAGELYWITVQGYGECLDWIMSESLQLNNLAYEMDGEWFTYEFDKGEHQGDLAFKLFGVPACPGDFVTSATAQPPGDGAVDAADLAYLLSTWGDNTDTFADLVTSETFQPPPDGFVDGADLAVLLGAWGKCD